MKDKDKIKGFGAAVGDCVSNEKPKPDEEPKTPPIIPESEEEFTIKGVKNLLRFKFGMNPKRLDSASDEQLREWLKSAGKKKEEVKKDPAPE